MDDVSACPSVDFSRSTTSNDLVDELEASLTSFVNLYDRHEDRLQRASESFTQTAARVREAREVVPANRTIRGVFGGALGAVSGAIAGGVGGALGAVAATTCQRLCGEIGAVGATVGFAGSVVGGVAGGVFSGSVGGAVGATTSSSSHGAVSDALWVAIGVATGGAIGGTFGRTVGAAGGAVGGGFGALLGTRFAVYVAGGEKEKKVTRQEVSVIQKTGLDFCETIKPLQVELSSIKTISEKIQFSPDVQRVTRQTAKTLAAAAAMEETAADPQRDADLTQFVEEAAKRSRRICEELKTTRTDAEKLLIPLRKL
ncbi:keratin, type I cytoskeletal 9-like [Hippoglossus stenolepis]|uniref:keratin, type I cytoskeletal 9-like n=1 Tax=Hippoglossus stenolepis TaxID=195615 RepID=UPI001FAF7F51|nr:keratin, type I cytoskeletal 9-like [Hippoglossus stenolepis]